MKALIILSIILIAAPAGAVDYIGDVQRIRATHDDTLLQIMRDHNLGYVEIRAANPGVDVWLPGQGMPIILPTRHILPDAPREGVVINLAEMRMYVFTEEEPITYPIGIGREGLNTPLGTTKITRKKDGPSWRPTPRMRAEDPELPAVVPPGEDNPLGTHALYLGWPAYLIHGTNRPWGIGRRVSSGCIRMYPEDIIKLFDKIPVGTKVTVVDQPVKLAVIDDVLFIEAHPGNSQLSDQVEEEGKVREYEVPEDLFKRLQKAAGDKRSLIDWPKVRQTLKERTGLPVAITRRSHDEREAITEWPPMEEEDTPVVETVYGEEPEGDDLRETAQMDIQANSDEDKAPRASRPRSFNN